jgi:hypothetical protein
MLPLLLLFAATACGDATVSEMPDPPIRALPNTYTATLQGGEADAVKTAVSALPGVDKVALEGQSLRIDLKPDATLTEDALAAALKPTGASASAFAGPSGEVVYVLAYLGGGG